MAQERYSLSPITPDDYPTLANIAVLSFMRNPFHYMTYPPNVSHDEIVQYTIDSKIRFAEEGRDVQTLKVVDNQTPDRQVVGFASWFLGPRPRSREPRRPEGANFKFLEDYRRKSNAGVKRIYDEEKDVGEFGHSLVGSERRLTGELAELNMIRVLPSYQGKGVGSMLLRWGLQKASQSGKRVFLQASPESRDLFLRNGFEVEGEVRMTLGEYGEVGVYIQSVMVWDGD
jgi:GNAT superfamily N-acetyltransferase